MRLNTYFDSRFVVLELGARDAPGVIAEIAACAERAGIAPAGTVGAKLMERERKHPTVIGSGLAVPHATVPGLAEPVIGVALAPEPIAFGREGMDPVRTFFVLLTPPGHERAHVKILARICRLVRHPEFAEQFAEVTDESSVFQAIETVDERH